MTNRERFATLLLSAALTLVFPLLSFSGPAVHAAPAAEVAAEAAAGDCGGSGYLSSQPENATFIVDLPVVARYEELLSHDQIEIPNGRPIYALFVHGYSQNWNFNLLMFYNFAKHLMADGAYVHWAWWNNLCKEYMGGPLHHPGAHPGEVGLHGMLDGLFDADQKALPPDDYQFQADAEAFLEAIRANNPDAIIIVVGHSMGGGAVARLGTNTEVKIDILGPIDPVENRSRPWMVWTPWAGNDWHNWTRRRIAHLEPEVLPPPNPVRRKFGNNVVHLYHRYQKEAIFPMDYYDDWLFQHDKPEGGSTSQEVTPTSTAEPCGSPTGGCSIDGHGELVGYRGANINGEGHPIALKAGSDWPTGTEPDDICLRQRLLMEMPFADYDNNWKYRPPEPDSCMVSGDLIALYERIINPPAPEPGGGSEVATAIVGAYPNPFNASTHIFFEVAGQSEGSGQSGVSGRQQGQHRVTLQIFDIRGRLVRTLEEGTFEAGRHEVFWNGTNDAGRAVASGTYFVRMRAGDRSEISKIILLK